MTLRRRRPGLVYPVWEDWHYVGGTDEPAFGSGWANGEAGKQKCAFRRREAGIVDLVGFVITTTTATPHVFTLPVGYRPDATAIILGARQDYGDLFIYADLVNISTAGVVSVDYAGAWANNDKFIFNGSFMLSPAAAL